VAAASYRLSDLVPGKSNSASSEAWQSQIPALGIKIGPTPDLTVSEPTGQTVTQAKQEVQPASASGIPEKVLTTVSMPL
jgi:hypothetical protein